MKDQLEAKKKELVLVKKENRKRRKIIEKYQRMLNAGATGLHSVRIINNKQCMLVYTCIPAEAIVGLI